MRRLTFRYLALTPALALALSQPAAAQDGLLILEPSTPWQLDYAETSWSLSRSFGESGETVVLQMTKHGPGGDLNFTVASPDFSLAEEEFQYRVLPDDDARLVKVALSGSSNESAAIRFGETLRAKADQSESGASVQAVDPERLRLIEGIGIAGAFSYDFILLTGPMLQANEAMDTCLADLLGSLGVDFATAASVARPAERREFARWARQTQEAYPREMVRKGIDAQVDVLLAIDTEGRVSHCKAEGPEDYPQFAEAACEVLMDKGLYVPARSAEGDPVVSVDSFTVTYSIH